MWYFILGIVSASILAYLLYWFFIPYFNYRRVYRQYSPENIRIFHGREQVTGSMDSMPLLKQEPTYDITVIFPCYNEEERFPGCMDDTVDFFQKGQWSAYKVQFILVNDGSTDKTQVMLIFREQVIRGYCEKYENHPRYQVIGITQPNGGKGRAVKTGAMQARGKVVFHADADNSTDIQDFAILYDELMLMKEQNNLAMVIGSRKLPGSKTIIKRTLLRKVLGLLFNTVFTRYIIGLPFRDTQCGFKFATHEAARAVYPVTHLGYWVWDPETLYITVQQDEEINDRMKIPVRELAVNCKDVEGSKVNLLSDALRMVRGLLLIKVMYCFRIWKLTDHAP